MALLLGVELLDELYSGVPSVGSAEIQGAFEASYAATAQALLFVPALAAMLIEPALFVLADRYPRKWFVGGGLLAMGLAALLAGTASSVVVLTAAISLAWVGSGSGVALAQATLVDAHPQGAERALTRWTLFGELGDLLAPLLMAGLAAASLGWREAYLLVGGLTSVWALLVLTRPFPAAGVKRPEAPAESPADADGEKDDETEPGVLAALRLAFGNRRLLFWLGATALCDLLDEIVVVFAALHLRDHAGFGPIERSLVVGAGVAGAIVGVLWTDRLLARIDPLRILLRASIACTVAYAGWIFAPTVGLSAAAFFCVGVLAAPMYPIASAQAYAALPGRSGTVNAAGHVFTPFTIALPWLLGMVADASAPRIALLLLLAQPVGLTILSSLALRWRSPP